MSLLLFVTYVLPMCLSLILYFYFLRDESKGFEDLHLYILWCVLPLLNWMIHIWTNQRATGKGNNNGIFICL